uniref:Bifunctional inhibitor/plant lipid transfer protein/seed storage helical domain-containing protein n=1 Tax=Leersia perrieri TaxID=77586 RepID=A0A0D9XND8_9ORYZ
MAPLALNSKLQLQVKKPAMVVLVIMATSMILLVAAAVGEMTTRCEGVESLTEPCVPFLTARTDELTYDCCDAAIKSVYYLDDVIQILGKDQLADICLCVEGLRSKYVIERRSTYDRLYRECLENSPVMKDIFPNVVRNITSINDCLSLYGAGGGN